MMTNERWYKTASHAIAFIVIAFFLYNIFLYVMNFQINHNEHMYVSAGVLIQHHRLYRDFAYLQMPYLPIIYGITYAVTHSTYYFFIARLYTFLFVCISVITLYLISFRISKSAFVSVVVVLFFLSNEATIETTQEVSNYIISIAFSLLALYTFLVGANKSKHIPWSIFLSGLCCAIAFGAKLYYGILIPAFVLALLLDRSNESRQKLAGWYMAGVVIGLLPVFYYFLADRTTFIFNNLYYHTINTAYVIGNSEVKDALSEKLYYAWRMLVRPLTWLTVVCAVAVFSVVGLQILQRKRFFVRLQSDTLLICLLIAFTTITSFIPTPLQKVYLSMPIPFFALLISCLYRYLANEQKCYLNVVLACQLGVCFYLGGPQQYFRYADTLYDSDEWTVFSTHQTAEKIRASSRVRDNQQKIATLAPIYALESQTNTYTEFSTGPFLYRIGDRITDSERQHFVATSPKTITNLFAKDPPQAIFVGFEDEDGLDQLFIDYAEQHHYSKVRKKFDGGTLYVLQTDTP